MTVLLTSVLCYQLIISRIYQLTQDIEFIFKWPFLRIIYFIQSLSLVLSYLAQVIILVDLLLPEKVIIDKKSPILIQAEVIYLNHDLSHFFVIAIELGSILLDLILEDFYSKFHL